MSETSKVQVPKDLQELYAESLKKEVYGYIQTKQLIERIAALTAELTATQEQLVMAHEEMATTNQLIVENAKLREALGPVTNTEWLNTCPSELKYCSLEQTHIVIVNALLSARAQKAGAK